MSILAAKEEAFQESIKLRNQFRNLDEDEVEFLDSVLESTRKKEEEVKKETSEQLDLFRRQQEEKDKELLEEVDGKAGSPTAGDSQSSWAVNARKRKRAKENDRAGLKGLKLRKSSSAGEAPVGLRTSSSTGEAPKDLGREAGNKKSVKPQHTASVNPSTKEKAAVGVSGSPPLPLIPKASPKQEDNFSVKLPGTLGLGLAGYSSDEDD